MDDKKLFDAPKFGPLPEDHDEILDSISRIDALPGGLGQKSQPLPEPIEILHFKPVKITESMLPPDVIRPVMVTAAEGLRMIADGHFHKSMIPKQLTCRKCDEELPPERGLYCRSCRPHLQEDPGSHIYCGASGE